MLISIITFLGCFFHRQLNQMLYYIQKNVPEMGEIPDLRIITVIFTPRKIIKFVTAQTEGLEHRGLGKRLASNGVIYYTLTL